MSEHRNGYSFVYRDGQYFPAPPTDAETDEDLARLGWSPSQTVGESAGLHYTLNSNSTEGRWLVVFATAGECCELFCETWPDLIDLLVKLSPIALAGMFEDEDLMAVGEILQPYKDAIRRRRVQHSIQSPKAGR